jgi:hypothetical protein
MSFGAYFHDINTQISLIALVGTCLFAWTKGGKAERLGTLMMFVSWIGTDVLRALDGHLMPTALMFGSDGLLSLGFLFIAVRYSSLWLGLAMLFESFIFGLHAIQLGDVDAPRWHGMIVYLLLNNILNYLVLATLVGGAGATALKRRQDRKAKKLAAERARPSLTAARLPLAGTL